MGKWDKLKQLDRFWPKGERVRMSMEALIGVNTFGSDRARAFAAEWAAALEADDEAAPVRAAEQIREQIRQELNPGLDNSAAIQDRRSRRAARTRRRGTQARPTV